TAAQGPALGPRRSGPDRSHPGREHRPVGDAAGLAPDHRATAGAQSQLPLQSLRFRRPQPPLAVPELQGVGHDQAPAQLRRRLMAPAAQALAWMLAGTVLGAVVTALARAYALRRRLIDLPGERRSHQAATPRGGGVSIVLVLLAGAGLLLVAGIGWLDGHRPLPAWPRLCVHALSAALLAAAAWSRGGDALDVSVAFASALVLVNVWNFMDGIDGIAAMQALV